MPALGWLSSLIGPRNLYIAGLLLTVISTMCCGLAWNLESLIFFRVLQGLGAPRDIANDSQSFAFPIPDQVGGSGPQLAGPDAQISSPKDDRGPLQDSLRSNGLTPAEPPQIAQTSSAASGFGATTGSQKPVSADFEAAFAGFDLTPAKDVDDKDDNDKGDDDDFKYQFNKDSSNFDLLFESPSAGSKPSTIANAAGTSSGNNTMNADFFSFDHDIQPTSAPTHPLFLQNPASSVPTKPSTTPDWNSLFSGLDTSTLGKSNAGDSGSSVGDNAGAASHIASREPAKAEVSSISPGDSSRQPGWALNADADEDDLILKSLTSMGYRRDESLDALEKFDYNLDEVVSPHVFPSDFMLLFSFLPSHFIPITLPHFPSSYSIAAMKLTRVTYATFAGSEFPRVEVLTRRLRFLIPLAYRPYIL